MTPEAHEPADPAEHAELVACMREYQAGSLAGFERLHTHVAGDLLRFFVAAVRDAAAAQDLVQETFLELHRARRTYLPPLPVRPWIFGIARNVERRHRQRTARRRERLVDPAELSAEPAAGPPTLERADLRAALRGVPASRRTVWLLHHWHGWSFAEIARRLGIGADAAKLRSSRTTRALRAFLGDRGRPHE